VKGALTVPQAIFFIFVIIISPIILAVKLREHYYDSARIHVQINVAVTLIITESNTGGGGGGRWLWQQLSF
jgi:hypothetical protein